MVPLRYLKISLFLRAGLFSALLVVAILHVRAVGWRLSAWYLLLALAALLLTLLRWRSWQKHRRHPKA